MSKSLSHRNKTGKRHTIGDDPRNSTLTRNKERNNNNKIPIAVTSCILVFIKKVFACKRNAKTIKFLKNLLFTFSTMCLQSRIGLSVLLLLLALCLCSSWPKVVYFSQNRRNYDSPLFKIGNYTRRCTKSLSQAAAPKFRIMQSNFKQQNT